MMSTLLPTRWLRLAPAACSLQVACTPPSAALQFQTNASLTPSLTPSGKSPDDVETSSAIVPAGACPSLKTDQYFLGHGQYGGRFRSSDLACLGQADPTTCLKIQSTSSLPSTPQVKLKGAVVGQSCSPDGVTSESLYTLGFTDSETLRVGPTNIVHVRLGVAKIPDPANGCDWQFSTSRQMILSRFTDDCGGTWMPFAALDRDSGAYENADFGKLDQPWLYHDPFAKPPGAPLHMLVYAGSPSSIKYVNRIEWFVSGDKGATWSKGDPAFSSTVPYGRMVMTSTADGTLFFFACKAFDTEAATTANSHPILFWKHGMNGKLQQQDLSTLTQVPCGLLTEAQWPSHVLNNVPPVVISRVDGASSAMQTIRVGYPYIQNQGTKQKPLWVQALTIRTIKVQHDAGTNADTVTGGLETAHFPTTSKASVFHAQFIQSDLIDDPKDSDLSILWWIEAMMANGDKPPFTARYAVVRSAGLWGAAAALSVNKSASPPGPVFWNYPAGTAAKPSMVGDYDHGGFFSSSGKMHFVMQWSQGSAASDPPGQNLTLHGESVVITP